MIKSPDPSEKALERYGRADFWRGFLYGTGNTLALVGLIALVSFLLGLVNGSAGAAP
jgi:ABC-type dipeptide/oligopeptide/nickel transport system permease subunit